MTHPAVKLVLDLIAPHPDRADGKPGLEPFKVVLDPGPLFELIADARDGYRVYELTLVERPGDVFEYLHVEPIELPRAVDRRVREARATAKTGRADPWPKGRVPFQVFDKFFCPQGEDTDHETSVWLHARRSAHMRDWLLTLVAIARSARAELESHGPLIEHELRSVGDGSHPYALMDRHAAIYESRSPLPAREQHHPGFYAMLRELLKDQEIAAVGYWGTGELATMRMLAGEQRRRANRTGHEPRNALQLNVMIDFAVYYVGWGTELTLKGEGLPDGDLFIRGRLNARREASYETPEISAQVHRRNRHARYILSYRDEGSLDGFERQVGVGFYLYRNKSPEPRRRCLRRFIGRVGPCVQPILDFEGDESAVLAFEKVVVVVGEGVDALARHRLADILRRWLGLTGRPVVVVCGTLTPFEDIPDLDLRAVPDSAEQDEAAAALTSALRGQVPSVDVVIALDPPRWFDEVLVKECRHDPSMRSVWIVATRDLDGAKADLKLDGDFVQILETAITRASDDAPA